MVFPGFSVGVLEFQPFRCGETESAYGWHGLGVDRTFLSWYILTCLIGGRDFTIDSSTVQEVMYHV
jgi:hypothetical protein